MNFNDDHFQRFFWNLCELAKASNARITDYHNYNQQSDSVCIKMLNHMKHLNAYLVRLYLSLNEKEKKEMDCFDLYISHLKYTVNKVNEIEKSPHRDIEFLLEEIQSKESKDEITNKQLEEEIENLEAEYHKTNLSRDKTILEVLRELLKDKEGRNIPEETKQKIREFIMLMSVKIKKESKDET